MMYDIILFLKKTIWGTYRELHGNKENYHSESTFCFGQMAYGI